jgi:S1-C subfamily serine protease
MMSGLAEASRDLAVLVAGTTGLVAAIRTGPGRHVTGLLWRADTVVTTDQPLPVQDSYTIVLDGTGLLAARPGPRDPALNLALLRLEAPVSPPALPAAADPPVGSLAILVGAGFDGTPTARLGMVHGRPRGDGLDTHGPLLDFSAQETELGGAVLDASGHLLGMAIAMAAGTVRLLPHAVITRLVEPAGPAQATASGGPRAVVRPAGQRRGWLGVSLQPITVPEPLVTRAGQNSGRMVVNLTHGGPADQAGLRVGDVLLALNGHSTSGSHALRAFLGADRIGTQIEVRLLRDGSILTTFLTVAAQPA